MTKALADAIRKFADDCESDQVVAAAFLKSGEQPARVLGCSKRDGAEACDRTTEEALARCISQAVSLERH